MKRGFKLILSALFLVWAGTAQCATTTLYEVTGRTVNVRSGPGKEHKVVGKLHQGDTVKVTRFHNADWMVIRWHFRTGYVNRNYLSYIGPEEEEETSYAHHWWSWLPDWNYYKYLRWAFWFLVLLILFPIVQRKGQNASWKWTYLLWFCSSLPFYILDVLQFWLAKPWRPFMKHNLLRDSYKKPMRIFLRILQIPFYIALFPLRFINAVYYNLIIHNIYELSNYLLEVGAPSDPKEGARNVWKWLVFLPKRIFKYLLFHGSLTLIESVIWTAIDTVFPAVTLYHGTDVSAADNMLCEPKRNTHRKLSSGWKSGTWTVGGGNYAGDGIYFGIFRKTLRNYQSGSAIVARVTMGKTIDTVLMPDYVYNQAGHPNASAVSNWGLRNGYVSGEWWRTSGRWWEICLFDRQNKYNDSWRIRPIYVISYGSGIMQRIPGGSAHWLFRKMVFSDLRATIQSYFRRKN